MLSNSASVPTLTFRGASNDHADILYVAQKFLKSYTPSDAYLPKGWVEVLEKTDREFRGVLGNPFSPSKVEKIRKQNERQTPVEPSGPSRTFESDCADETIQIIERLDTQDEVVSFLLQRTVDSSSMVEWFANIDAVFKVRPGWVGEILSELEERVRKLKLIPVKRRLYYALICEFCKLKLKVLEANGDCSTLSTLMREIDASRIRDLYTSLSLRELKLAAKCNESDSMAMIQSELFPLLIRDVPFVMLQRIAQMAFDIDIFIEDKERYHLSEINSGVPPIWWRDHPAHRWSDSWAKSHTSNNSSSYRSSNAGEDDEDQLHQSLSQSVAVSYEAPWVMPSLGKEQPRQSVASSRRQSLIVPARAIKMEGRRQSYRPSPVDASEEALCVVPSEPAEDGFMISRGVLDAMRDWQHEESQAKPQLGGIHDVLEDLLHSPSQPCTREQTPVKTARKRSNQATPCSSKRAKKTPPLPSDENARPSQFDDIRISSLLLESAGPPPLHKTTPVTVCKPKSRMSDPKDIPSDRAARKKLRDLEDYHKLNIL